jgi:hypothetical protein
MLSVRTNPPLQTGSPLRPLLYALRDNLGLHGPRCSNWVDHEKRVRRFFHPAQDPACRSSRLDYDPSSMLR